MKSFWITVIIGACLAGGCKKESSTATPQPVSNETIVAENVVPAYPAEVIVETYSEHGTSRNSSTIDSRRERKSSPLDIPGAVGKSEEWSSVEMSFTSTVGPGRKCIIKPTLLRHEDGKDIWELELMYETSEDGITTRLSRKHQVEFDGQNPVVVVEDESHKIILRPRAEEEAETSSTDSQPASE